MSRAGNLATHIERTVTGPMWHGSPLGELLEGVTPERAAAHPIAGAHSIWEIVHHVIAWAQIARQRVKGDSTGDPTPEQDWPRVSATGSGDWRAAVDRLKACHFELAADTRALDDAQLDAKVTSLTYSVSVLLHGIVEHGTYHGGQIALLKKA
jgi:uncharacterized damage-inducible protein DinB